MIQRIFLGTANILIPDPKTTLMLAEEPIKDHSIFEYLQKVSFRYIIPQTMFGIWYLPKVSIYDFRHSVNIQTEPAFMKGNFAGLISALNKPASIEVTQDKDHLNIFLGDAPLGSFKKNMKHTLEVGVTREGQHRTHKYIFFKQGSLTPEKIFFATLYKSG